MRLSRFLIPVFALSTLLSVSCKAIKTAPFDQYSYQKAIDIKVEMTDLMDDATEAYAKHQAEIQELLSEVEKLKEYEKYKPNNEISFQMWKILSDKERNLLAGFFQRWKEKGSLSPTFTNEVKGQVVEALNLIIEYEAQKKPETKDKLMGLIQNY